MELEDEAERLHAVKVDGDDDDNNHNGGGSTSTDGGGDTLLYHRDFLAKTRKVYDDYKHVNYRYIDFGIMGGRPLVMQQDRSLGKGGKLLLCLFSLVMKVWRMNGTFLYTQHSCFLFVLIVVGY
jgi:hypothetical protein